MNHRTFVLLALVLASLFACGTSSPDDVDLAGRDPRCVAACPATEPRYEGVGRVCNAASREQCLDECEVRIAGVSSLCQSCLADEACFAPDGDGCGSDDISLGCTPTTCTVYGELGTCMYPVGDDAAELRCYQQVDPRREVTCSAEWRPTTDCATVCP
jgi:hypothetical protein